MSSANSIHSEDVSLRVSDDKCSPAEAVREYINGLPKVFEEDSMARGADGVVHISEELSRLNRADLKQFALRQFLRCEELLHELLDQEVVLGETVDDLQSVREMMEEREEEAEALRAQLQRADESKETLLREKASALRRLMETKNELASLSATKANLQRMLDLHNKKQGEEAPAPQGTPAATTNAAAAAAAEMRRCSMPNANAQAGLLNRNFMRANSYAPVMTSFSTACSLAVPQRVGLSRRSSCSSNATSSTKLWSGGANPVVERSKSPGDSKWRQLFFETRRQNELLQSELSKIRADRCCVDTDAGNGEVSQTAHVNLSSSQLAASLAEVERMREELNKEREKNRTRNRLGAQLLRDVAFLARKVRMYEQAESASLLHRYKDLSLTKDQLMQELFESRKAIAVLNMKLKESTTRVGKKHNGSQCEATSQPVIVEGLANALEEALRDNEILREERGCLISEKRFREESYQAELKSRVVEMEKLTAALDELRGQMAQLWKGKRGTNSNSTATPATKFRSPSRSLPQNGAPAGFRLSVEDGVVKVIDGSGCSPCTSCSITQNSNTTPMSNCNNAKVKPKLSPMRSAVPVL